MAVIAVAGGSKQPGAVPDPEPSVSESAAPEESADAAASEDTGVAVSRFDDSGYNRAPVWSVRDPKGGTSEPVKEGEVNYRNPSLQCTFTIY